MSLDNTTPKYTILYVDDELIHLYAFKSSYKGLYNIITAKSAEEGLNILETTTVHVIVSDQRMDSMSGIEFLTIVKNKWPKIIRIMLSAYTDSESIKRAVNEAEVYRYLVKPFKDVDVIPNINQALETYQLKADLEDSQKQLGNAEEKLIKIVETAKDAIITIDDKFNMVMVNDATCNMFGYSKEGLLGKSVNLLIEKGFWKKHDYYIRKFSKEENNAARMAEKKEVYGVLSNGNKIPIESSLSKMNVDGKTYYNAIIRDITKRKAREIEIFEFEKQIRMLADIVSHSTDAIISTNLEGLVISWNLGAEKLLGYSSQEMMGNSIDVLAPNYLINDHNQVISRVLKGESIEGYETFQTPKDGESMIVSMSIFPLTDNNGRVKGISSVLRDISAQKEVELIKENFTKKLENKVKERTLELELARKKLASSLEKEKELGELKSRFVATASHQFRTPLTVIQSNMGLLAMQVDTMDAEFKPKFEKVYNRIKGQISKMTMLMNDVLILGKINAGNVVANINSISFINLCEDLKSNFDEIQDDNRRLSLLIEGKVRNLDLDAKLIGHAISNIISNAFKFSKGRESPELTITFFEYEVVVMIKDYGLGIPNMDVKQIFEPFYRGSNVGEIPGTGLGTAITKEYIELNGGEISIHTELNRGTEFIITLKK